jgi:MFS family permease
MALAIPVGRLADRIGRVPVLLVGHALLLAVYGLMLYSTGATVIWVSLLALGAYYAATEGVTTALAGAILPERFQATGIGVLITVISIGQFASSLAFGALWFEFGLDTAVMLFGIALVVMLAVSTPLLLRVKDVRAFE